MLFCFYCCFDATCCSKVEYYTKGNTVLYGICTVLHGTRYYTVHSTARYWKIHGTAHCYNVHCTVLYSSERHTEVHVTSRYCTVLQSFIRYCTCSVAIDGDCLGSYQNLD